MAPFLRPGVATRMLDLYKIYPDAALREFAPEAPAGLDGEEGEEAGESLQASKKGQSGGGGS